MTGSVAAEVPTTLAADDEQADADLARGLLLRLSALLLSALLLSARGVAAPLAWIRKNDSLSEIAQSGSHVVEYCDVMSRENVEAVQRAYEAFGRGDVEEAFATLHPDIVFKPTHEAPVQGRDAVRASLERWRAPWEGHEMILEETIDAGDHVIQPILFRGRGRGSGIEIESRFFQVFTIQDGLAVRWEEFTHKSEAFEAAGLPDQDSPGNS